MAHFDLEKTNIINALCEIPREQRDAVWVERFFDALPDASMATREGQVFRGPEGFTYFDLHIPEPGKPFETFCVSQLLEHCTTGGLGIAVNPEKQPPDWVFSYGDLWGLRHAGSLRLREPNPGQLSQGGQVLVAAPSEQLLPTWARGVLKSFIGWLKVPEPKVLLLVSQEARPAETLVFNVHAEDLGQEAFANAQRMLSWFIPPHLNVAYVNKGSQFEGQFVPL